MQTLFIHNKPVIISRNGDDESSIYFSNLTVLQDPQVKMLSALLEKLEDKSVNGYHFVVDQPATIWDAVMKTFNHWQAAGGLVTNSAGEILLLFRRGKWDLPKGKIDSPENPEETALREVTEETGLKNIKILRKLVDTWHTYPMSVYNNENIKKGRENKLQKDILKQTHWYKMEFNGTELTVPQIEEDIIDIQWIKPENISKYVKYSYPNLKLVFASAGYEV